MKLTVRLTQERTGYRRFRKVYTRRRNTFDFEANPDTGFYEYTLTAETPEELQQKLDDIFEACNSCTYPATIVIDKDAFHALTAKPRAPISEYTPAEYKELGDTALRTLCDELSIPYNDRNTVNSLREKLELYHLAQCRLIERYELPEGAEPEQPSPEMVEAETEFAKTMKEAEEKKTAEANAKEAEEREKQMPQSEVLHLSKEDLREYINGFNDKEGLAELVERLTGEKIDKRKNLANTRKYAIRHLEYKQVELAAQSKKKGE
jgi:hypothetical protein